MVRTYRRCPVTSLHYRVKKRSAWMSQPFADRTGSFDVSLNNPWCADRFLACQMVWAGDWFPRFQVTVADTLNVYSYRSLGHPKYGLLTEGDAYEAARAEGDKWVASNLSLIRDIYGGRVEILHWDDWLSRPDFTQYADAVRRLAESVPEFRSAIDRDIAAYIRRRSLPDPRPHAMRLLREYMIEELAVYQQQAAEGIVNLYPGSENGVLRFIRCERAAAHELRPHQFVYFEFRQVVS